MKIHKMSRIHFFMLAVLSAINSCGQTGPLYMPETNNFDKNNLVESKTIAQTKRD